jgi:hypothetical protein
MKRQFRDLPTWEFETTEVSIGVYEVAGQDDAGHRVSAKGTDPDFLLEQCRNEAVRYLQNEMKFEQPPHLQAMIDSSETEIRGDFLMIDGQVVADASTLRIETLRDEYLREIGRDASGWDTLYMDPYDGRLWEHTYPQSHMHGGGPPLLRLIGTEEARRKYGASFQ